MKYIHRSIFIFIFFTTTSFAQVETITWQKCFGTTGDYSSDIVKGVGKFNDGYIFGIGVDQTEPWISNYHGSADAWIVNTDSVGNVIWEKCYGGSNSDGPRKIIPIDSNYIYLLNGTSSSDGDVHNFSNDIAAIWVVKINKQGDIIWENCYGGSQVEEIRDALLTPDGGLLIMSRISAADGDISEHYGSVDIWICKIDSLGNIEWEKTLGNHGTENAITMEFTSDTSFFVLAGVNETGGMVDCDCNINPVSNIDLDVWLVEMNMEGNILRQLCYGGTGHELVRDIVKTEDGFVFASSTDSDDGDVSGLHTGVPGMPKDDIWVVKIDYDGNIIWQNCLGGSEYEWPKYVTQTQDSGIIVIGNVTSNDGDVSNNHSDVGRLDVWVVKLDKNGILLWEHCFGGLGNEQIWSCNNIIKNDDYNYVVGVQSLGITGDVECELNSDPYIPSDDTWIINIKDCSQYQPTTPIKPIGKDYFCVNTDSVTTYITQIAHGAWYYEWELTPGEAGTLDIDSITTQIHWSPTYEGQATIKVRSDNDCGTSAWSDSLIIHTYICLGTEENNTNNHLLSVYPNPASSTLTIRYNKPVHKTPSTIKIFNIYGTTVFTQNMEAQKKKAVLDIANLTAGLYFVRVIEDGILIGVRKVVVE